VLGLPAAGGRGGGRGAPAENANRAFQGARTRTTWSPWATPIQRADRGSQRPLDSGAPQSGEAPDVTAKFHNGLQEMAEASRLGIPLVFSTDPRNGPGRALPMPSRRSRSGPISSAGAAAIRNWCASLARIAAQELRALGIRVLLGPMADTTTSRDGTASAALSAKTPI